MNRLTYIIGYRNSIKNKRKEDLLEKQKRNTISSKNKQSFRKGSCRRLQEKSKRRDS